MYIPHLTTNFFLNSSTFCNIFISGIKIQGELYLCQLNGRSYIALGTPNSLLHRRHFVIKLTITADTTGVFQSSIISSSSFLRFVFMFSQVCISLGKVRSLPAMMGSTKVTDRVHPEAIAVKGHIIEVKGHGGQRSWRSKVMEVKAQSPILTYRYRYMLQNCICVLSCMGFFGIRLWHTSIYIYTYGGTNRKCILKLVNYVHEAHSTTTDKWPIDKV